MQQWKNYILATDLINWLSRTKSLSIFGPLGGAKPWDLIRHPVSSFKDAEHLEIVGEWSGLYVSSIVKWLNFPNVKTLKIRGISKWENGTVELDIEKIRTAPFTFLSIGSYHDGPEALGFLIKWPAILTHFECGSIHNNSHDFTCAMFESWLLIHKETLKHIKIGSVSHHRSNCVFNATLFPHLESLGISHWDMKSRPGSAVEYLNLLGPKVETISWDFADTEYDTKGTCHFGEPEASKLRALVEAAISRKAPLKTIKINFQMCNWCCTEYPCDRTDEIRDRLMRPQGLDLVYNEHLMPRDEWLNYRKTGKLAPEEPVQHASWKYQSTPKDEQEEEFEMDNYIDELQPCTGYHGQDVRTLLLGL
ncbi:hypothetical protein BKA66DRAFT_409403 [Pyrenochaeta sp. MPI-SDFR-AT-0127]|nr:hypothetical protein BKA66DRAFT_409403 [Pyrenochaeta sp. MPI-SDFR-AT-0127]